MRNDIAAATQRSEGACAVTKGYVRDASENLAAIRELCPDMPEMMRQCDMIEEDLEAMDQRVRWAMETCPRKDEAGEGTTCESVECPMAACRLWAATVGMSVGMLKAVGTVRAGIRNTRAH